ncbi:S8 family serine peptidase [Candidatus Mycoplasma pogonae]
MVIEHNVRVINHSYGSNDLDNQVDYDDSSFFIDYLASKYGVINVFAAGNGHAKPKERDEWIDSTLLSFNSIVVGSADAKNNKDYYPSLFSNRKKFGKYKDLPKPLVVAPGEGYRYNQNDFLDKGTSYAAPIVTGTINVLLRENSNLNNENRVQSIKAILAASGQESINNFSDKTNINSNGLNNAVGAGMINYEEMQKAANNLVNVDTKNKENGKIYESKPISLKNGETIQIASAWLFNALDKPNLKNGSFWNNFLKNENHKFFTDYDLHLELKNELGKWIQVKYINVIHSNVEFIRFKSEKNAEYRILIKKYSNKNDENSNIDKLAVTYVKK